MLKHIPQPSRPIPQKTQPSVKTARCTNCNGTGRIQLKTKDDKCTDCHGTGCNKGVKSDPCHTCNGNGRISSPRMETQRCNRCLGHGTIAY